MHPPNRPGFLRSGVGLIGRSINDDDTGAARSTATTEKSSNSNSSSSMWQQQMQQVQTHSGGQSSFAAGVEIAVIVDVNHLAIFKCAIGEKNAENNAECLLQPRQWDVELRQRYL